MVKLEAIINCLSLLFTPILFLPLIKNPEDGFRKDPACFGFRLKNVCFSSVLFLRGIFLFYSREVE